MRSEPRPRPRTVLPWANEPGADGIVHMWGEHLLAIERQGREWCSLRARYPDAPLIVAGDFNQDRDGSGWYGSRQVRARLTEQLDAAGLTVVTALDVVAHGLLREHHLIDHIAISAGLAAGARVLCWESRDDAVRLSDHPTVAVDFVDFPAV